MSASLAYRIAVPLVIAMAAGFFGYYHGYKHAETKERLEFAVYREEAAKKLTAQIDKAREQEAFWSAKLQESQDEARQREARLRADLDRVRAESDRLRDNLATASVRLRLPDTPVPAVVEYADTAGELLAQCTEAYRDLASKADGHATDALMLLNAWPVPSVAESDNPKGN